MSYQLLDDALTSVIVDGSEEEQARWLILEPHMEYSGMWEVNSLGDDFRFDLHDHIGPQRVVTPANLQTFLVAAAEHEYQVAFGDDPEELLSFYARLSDSPGVSLTSNMPGTVSGLLPFQVRGYNFLKDQPRCGVGQWSTGTGKSVLQSALLKHHRDADNFAVSWSVVKGHNKINTQRRYLALTGIEAMILDGTPRQREGQYIELLERLDSGARGITVVTNYEKFREDFVTFERTKDKRWTGRLNDTFLPFFHVDALWLWDEMPTKLKHRTTKLYVAIQTCLYTGLVPKWEKRRSEWLRQFMFSATPIENDPEDWFNCVRLMDPDLYGTVKEFRNQYVKRYSYFDPHKPEVWHNLDHMQLKASGVVHQADKEKDPEIRAQFPAVFEDPRFLDWAPEHAKTYLRLLDLAEQAAAEAQEEGEPVNVLALIGVMQMLCDAPSMIGNSAALREAWEAAAEDWSGEGTPPPPEGSKLARRLLEALEGQLPSDETHTKLQELRTILIEEYPKEKVVVFTRFNRALIPTLSMWLTTWGISHVAYGGTRRQMQDAHDAFMTDPSIRVFLSSDKGSDSIDLDVARVTVNYDLPLLWARKVQRQNRIHRITSGFSENYSIDLIMGGSVEERILEIIEKKRGYHEAVFGGVITDQSLSAGMSGTDLRYILGV